MIYLDPKKVEMDITNYTGQGTINIQRQEDGSLTINIIDLHNINDSEDILGIPFSGDAGLVFLGESKGLIKTDRQDFSVGNLSEFNTHTR